MTTLGNVRDHHKKKFGVITMKTCKCRIRSSISVRRYIKYVRRNRDWPLSHDIGIAKKRLNEIAYISRQNVSRPSGGHGFPGFWDFFYYIRLFRAPRRFLGAVKIATESWECILSDPKVWSTGVDLLGNISIHFAIVYL